MWDPPGSEIEPCLLHWQADYLPLSHQESPKIFCFFKCPLLPHRNKEGLNVATLHFAEKPEACIFWVKSLNFWMWSANFGLPRWLSGKESACQSRRHQRCWFNSWVLEKGMATHLLRKSHGHRSLVGYSPWCRRVRHDWAHMPFYIRNLSIHEFCVQVGSWDQSPVDAEGEQQWHLYK